MNNQGGTYVLTMSPRLIQQTANEHFHALAYHSRLVALPESSTAFFKVFGFQSLRPAFFLRRQDFYWRLVMYVVTTKEAYAGETTKNAYLV